MNNTQLYLLAQTQVCFKIWTQPFLMPYKTHLKSRRRFTFLKTQESISLDSLLAHADFT